MASKRLSEVTEQLRLRLTPQYVQAQVSELIGEGEDVGGGINAFRLLRHLLGAEPATDEQLTQVYGELKPALKAALEQVPSLFYFEGD